MYTIEVTMKGCTGPTQWEYTKKGDAMDAWDLAVDFAVGGDRLRLKHFHEVLSTYAPVDRSKV